MRNQFSTSWIASKQPRKQRKYIHNAPLHLRHRLLGAHLSKELRKKYNKRAIPVRKGDEVIVMRGKFKKKKGKVSQANLKKGTIFIEGLQRQKKEGAKANIPFFPSKVQILSLNLDDKERIKSLERRKTENAPNKS